MNEQQIKDGQNCPRPGCQQNYADVKRLQSELDDEMAGRRLMAKATDRINDLEAENARLQKDLKAELDGREVLTRTMKRNQYLEAMIEEVKSRNADLQYKNAELAIKIREAEEGTNATYAVNTGLVAKNAKFEAALSDMLLLIAEHGGRVMQAHATRIAEARKTLYRKGGEEWAELSLQKLDGTSKAGQPK